MDSQIAGEGTPLPPRKRAIRLETARDARRFLVRIINDVYRDEMSPSKASRIGYLLGIFIKSLEVDELERRVSELETRR